LQLLCGAHAALQGWRDTRRQETWFSIRLPERDHATR